MGPRGDLDVVKIKMSGPTGNRIPVSRSFNLLYRLSYFDSLQDKSILPNIRISSEIFLRVASSVWHIRVCHIDGDFMVVLCSYFCCLELSATLGLRPCSLRKRENGS
jgi:hypothetical protein